MLPLADYFFWELVFEFLGPQDLIAVSGLCYSWWRFVFSGNRSIRQALLSCDVLDMSNSGKLYQKFPLWLFRGIQKLSLAGTTICSKNFLRLATEAQKLRTLDIENCRNISEEAIFNAKYKLQSLRSVNISYNSQFGVLTIACLLSYESVIDICCRGKKLTDKELLFLSKTFPSLPGIGLRLDGISKDYFWDFSDSDEDPMITLSEDSAEDQ